MHIAEALGHWAIFTATVEGGPLLKPQAAEGKGAEGAKTRALPP